MKPLIPRLRGWLFHRLSPLTQSQDLRRLQRLNEAAEAPSVRADTAGPVVSLTSHGKRIDTVHYAIESIGRGSMKPSRIMLWLNDADTVSNPPPPLRRLQRRGLEIMLCENYGPHTKYYPYVAASESHKVPMATIDDDIVYPRWWLDRLYREYERNSHVINCFQAHVIALDPATGQPLPYDRWPLCRSSAPSFGNFATGVSGVIYPPAFLDHLRGQGTAFLEDLKYQDDIWLHLCAIRGGWAIRQVDAFARHFQIVPGSGDFEPLVARNIGMAGNDRSIARAYTRRDVELVAKGRPS